MAPAPTPTARPAGGAPVPWGLPPPFRAPAPAQAAALRRVYDRVDESLAAESATCLACGRCCEFRPGGIVLFASALEMACLVAEAGPPAADRQVAPGAADDAWRCPYQALPSGAVPTGRCTARRVRPLGCRTYFCEAAAGEAGERLHDPAFREIRAIAGPGAWWYGPTRAYLAAWGI